MYGKEFYIRFVSIFNIRSLTDKNLDKLLRDFAKGNFDNEFSMIALRLPIGDMSFEQRFDAVRDCFDRKN